MKELRTLLLSLRKNDKIQQNVLFMIFESFRYREEEISKKLLEYYSECVNKEPILDFLFILCSKDVNYLDFFKKNKKCFKGLSHKFVSLLERNFLEKKNLNFDKHKIKHKEEEQRKKIKNAQNDKNKEVYSEIFEDELEKNEQKNSNNRETKISFEKQIEQTSNDYNETKFISERQIEQTSNDFKETKFLSEKQIEQNSSNSNEAKLSSDKQIEQKINGQKEAKLSVYEIELEKNKIKTKKGKLDILDNEYINIEQDPSILYELNQCKLCGIRYKNTPEGDEKMLNHVEEHRRKTRILSERDCISREFFPTLEAWTKNIEKVKLSLKVEKVEKIVHLGGPVFCEICRSKIDVVWDDKEDNWILKDSVSFVKGFNTTYCHRRCVT